MSPSDRRTSDAVAAGNLPQPQPPPVPPPCYRHPEQAASVLCAHCNRPICTDCMVEARVGWQCPECTSEGAKRSRHVPAFTHTSRNRTGVVGSTNPTPLVLVIIAVNVVVFFLEGFGTNNRVIDRYGLVARRDPPSHQYYRAFTAMWLHASFEHIFFNMITLLIVGPALEVLLGKLRFIALYLLAGLGGSVGSYLLGPHNELGIGASGAIMGVLGAYLVVGCAAACRCSRWPSCSSSTWSSASGATSTGGPTSAASPSAPPGPPLRLRRRPARRQDGPGADRRGERGHAGPPGAAHHLHRARALQSELSGRPLRSGSPGPAAGIGCGGVTRRPTPKQPRVVDSETKNAILFHQWVQFAART